MKSNTNVFNVTYSDGQAIIGVAYDSISWGEETMFFWYQKTGKTRVSINGKSILSSWSEDFVLVCLLCMGGEPKKNALFC